MQIVYILFCFILLSYFLFSTTGFIWLANRSERFVTMHVVGGGGSAQFSLGQKWWAEVEESKRPTGEAFEEEVMKNWDAQYGGQS